MNRWWLRTISKFLFGTADRNKSRKAARSSPLLLERLEPRDTPASFTLSQNTQSLISTAINNGPGVDNINYLNAYNAISTDIDAYNMANPSNPINSGTAQWFSKAGPVNSEQYSSNAFGNYIWNYTIGAVASEGGSVNMPQLQTASNQIGNTTFQQLQDANYVFSDDANAPINFSPKAIVANEYGAGFSYIQSVNPGVSLDHAVWGGALFATTMLNDPTFFSDNNLIIAPGTQDCKAIINGFADGLASEVTNGIVPLNMATSLANIGNFDWGTLETCMGVSSSSNNSTVTITNQGSGGYQYDINGNGENGGYFTSDTTYNTSTSNWSITTDDFSSTGNEINQTISSFANNILTAGTQGFNASGTIIYTQNTTTGTNGQTSSTITGTGDDSYLGDANITLSSGASATFDGSGDTINIGGNDTINAGTGGDNTFTFNGAFGNDVINNISRDDFLNIDGSLFSGVAQQAGNNLWTLGSDTLSLNGTSLVIHDGANSITLDDYFDGVGGILLDRRGEPQFNQSYPIDITPISPLILNLSGAGFATVGLKDSNNVYFDLTGDGLATATDWITPTEGFLVQDLNGNGKIDNITEMFGDNGGTSAWAKLAALDTNHDGVINASAPGFASLEIWQDTNGDGITEPGELHPLSYYGITSITLEQSTATSTDINGDEFSGLATFTYSNGTTGQMTDVFLQDDSEDSWYVGNGTPQSLAVPSDAFSLPMSRGYGVLLSWQFAMEQDPTLHTMMQNLVKDTPANMLGIYSDITNFMYEWAGVENFDPNRWNSDGATTDGRQMAFLAQSLDQQPTSTGLTPDIGDVDTNDFGADFDEIKDRILVQGTFANLFPNSHYDFVSDRLIIGGSLSSILNGAAAEQPTDPMNNLLFWQTIGEIVVGHAADLGITQANVQAELDAAAGHHITVATQFLLSNNFSTPNTGNYFISGSVGGEYTGGSGDDTIVVGGNARVNDSPYLDGAGGNDTYIVPTLDQTYTILNFSSTHSVPTGTLIFGPAITADSLNFRVIAGCLDISVNGNTTNSIGINGWSANSTSLLASIIAGDGTVYTVGTQGQLAWNDSASTSVTQFFNPTINNASQYVHYSGLNGTGSVTKEVIDNGDGTSQVQLYTDLPDNVSLESEDYTGTNGSGTLQDIILSWTAGGSQKQLQAGLPSGAAQEFLNYSGANASGTLNSIVTNWTAGGSLVQSLTYSSSVNTETDCAYTGPAGTGTLLYTQTTSTTLSTGAVSISISGAGDTVNRSNATITLAAGTQVTIGGSNNQISSTSSTIALSSGVTSDTISGSGNSIRAATSDHFIVGGTNNAITASSATITLAASSTGDSLTGNSNTVNVASGDSLTVTGTSNKVNASSGTIAFGAASTGETVTGSGNHVSAAASDSFTLNGSNEVVSASSDTITLGASSTGDTITGSGNTISTATSDKFTVTGANNKFTATSNTITVGAGSTGDTLSGGSDTVTLANGDSLTVGGASHKITGSSVTIAFGSAATGETVTGSGDAITLTSGNSVTISGGSETITATSATITFSTANGTDSVSGASNTVNAATGDSLTVTGTSNKVNASSGTVAFGAASTGETVTGSGNHVSAAASDSFTLNGSNEVVSASSDTITLGASSTGDTITGSGNTISTATSDKFTVTGANNKFTATSNTITVGAGSTGDILAGGSDTVSLANNDSLTVGGTNHKITGSSVTIAFNAGATGETVTGNSDHISLSSGNSVTINGSTETITASSATITFGASSTGDVITGNSDTITGGTGDIVTFDGTAGTVTMGSGSKFTDNYTAGNSMVELFAPTTGVANEMENFSAANGTGTDTSNIFNFSAGGSQKQLLTGLPAGASQKVINYAGANATGTVTSTLLYGDANNDTLTATTTNETLIGNGGYDTYKYTTSDGQDVIKNGLSTNPGATGELDFGAGIATNQIWLQRVGNDLQLDIMGTQDHITIAGWYNNAYSDLQEIKVSTGKMLDSQLSQLVQAMAAYSAANPSFNPTTVSQVPNDPTLQSELVSAWHS